MNTNPAAQPENVLINVTVSDNKQHAFITLIVSTIEGEPLSKPLITNALKRAGVVHGIDDQTINNILRHPPYNRQQLAATATQPQNGRNAVIEYLFPITSEVKPKELPNGTVDFKQLNLIKNVFTGDLLCKKTPPTLGTPGINVLGDPIPPQPGRDVPLPVGQNTVPSEDGLELRAKTNGQVDLNNRRVSVQQVYSIPENVDYTTGNIDFAGNVTVGGDVCAGFSVRAAGNVFINGGIDGGVVEAGGNISVANGVNSQNNGKVTCGGDLRCKYLQNANVDVENNLETTSCVNSVVRVGGVAKFIGSQAMLLSSRIVAGKMVETLNIGSKKSTAVSVVEVGVNPRIAERAAAIKNETVQLHKKIEGVKKIVDLYRQLEAQNRLSTDKKAELAKLTATMASAEQELIQLALEQEDIAERMKGLGYGAIKVFGTAFAGTQIAIGTERKQLATDYPYVQFVRTLEGISSSPAQR